jgi:hypothetical protein
MRVACSLVLSAALAFPSALFSAPRTTQAGDAKQAAPDAASATPPQAATAQASPQSTATQPAPTPVATAPVTKAPFAFGLEDATPVNLRLTRELSSATAQVSDRVEFEVVEDIKVHDVVVIPKGGKALGEVVIAQPKRRMGRGGKLDVKIENVRLVTGEKVALRANRNTNGGGHQGAMAGAMVATSVVFFPAAPLFLLMHGKDIVIPKGTEITAYIDDDIPLDQAKFAATPGTK